MLHTISLPFHTIPHNTMHAQSAGGETIHDTRPKRIRLTFSFLLCVHIWRHNFYHFVWIYLCANAKKVESLLNGIKKYMYGSHTQHNYSHYYSIHKCTCFEESTFKSIEEKLNGKINSISHTFMLVWVWKEA